MKYLALIASLFLVACGTSTDQPAAPETPADPVAEAPARAQPAAAPTWTTGPTMIDFSDPEPPHGVAEISGMANPEAWGRWSNQDTVRIRFDDPLPPQFQLELVARAFGPNVGAPIRVRVGNVEQKFGATNSDAPYRMHFTIAGTADTIEFTGITPTSPASVGVSNDPRPLGLGFASATITPTANAPTAARPQLIQRAPLTAPKNTDG
jgi:hypothetical protein